MHMPGSLTSRTASRLLLAVPAVVVTFGIAFNVATVAGDYWVVLLLEGTSVTQGFGLWRTCTSELAGYRKRCLRLDDHPKLLGAIGGEGYIESSRALALTSLISSGLTLLLALAALVSSIKKRQLLSQTASFTAAILSLGLQAICLTAALTVYVTVFKGSADPASPDVEIELGWSFVLGCVAVGFYLCGCATFVCGGLLTQRHFQHEKPSSTAEEVDKTRSVDEKPRRAPTFVEPTLSLGASHDSSLHSHSPKSTPTQKLEVLSSSFPDIDNEVPSLSALMQMSFGGGGRSGFSGEKEPATVYLELQRAESSDCHTMAHKVEEMDCRSSTSCA